MLDKELAASESAGVAAKTKANLRERARAELRELLGISLYLFVTFSVFIVYRHTVEAEFQPGPIQFGLAALKALVAAKAILLFQNFAFTKLLEDRPLIFPTLYKTLVFSLFALLLSALEGGILGLLHHQGFVAGVHHEVASGSEFLGRALALSVTYATFFAIRELDRVLGHGTVTRPFVNRGTPAVGA